MSQALHGIPTPPCRIARVTRLSSFRRYGTVRRLCPLVHDGRQLRSQAAAASHRSANQVRAGTRPFGHTVQRRSESDSPTLPVPSASPLSDAVQAAIQKPMKRLTATCKVCKYRATHHFSKQAYDHGAVLITCPSCKSRHLIADNLKIFRDERTNLDDLMREGGQVIRKGVVSAIEGVEGDVEVIEDKGKIVVRGSGS